MNIKYTSLFKVIVAHSYYASTICDCLHFKANTDTQKLMGKFGLVMKATTNGFEVYTSTNQSIEDFLNYIKQDSETNSFEFNGITSDEAFYNFTELPINQIGVLTYTSNNSENVENGKTIQLAETFDTKASTQEAVKISIKFEDIIRLIKSIDSIQFSIQMQARETIWDYYIINNSNQEFNQLSIEANNQIIIGQSQEVRLQNGQEALLFSTSPTKIPLKNEVNYTINLVNIKETKADKQKTIIFKSLPIPNPKDLQLKQNNELITVSSPMYVYI